MKTLNSGDDRVALVIKIIELNYLRSNFAIKDLLESALIKRESNSGDDYLFVWEDVSWNVCLDNIKALMLRLDQFRIENRSKQYLFLQTNLNHSILVQMGLYRSNPFNLQIELVLNGEANIYWDDPIVAARDRAVKYIKHSIISLGLAKDIEFAVMEAIQKEVKNNNIAFDRNGLRYKLSETIGSFVKEMAKEHIK